MGAFFDGYELNRYPLMGQSLFHLVDSSDRLVGGLLISPVRFFPASGIIRRFSSISLR